MIEAGCLNGVDVIFGTHLWTTEKLGTLAVRPGPIIKEELERIVKATYSANKCKYDFNYYKGFPTVVNDEAATNYIKEIAQNIPDLENVTEIEAQMTGEDFAYYLHHVDGCFFFTVAMPDDETKAFPHHHPKFDINEKAMLIAAKTLGSAAINYR